LRSLSILAKIQLYQSNPLLFRINFIQFAVLPGMHAIDIVVRNTLPIYLTPVTNTKHNHCTKISVGNGAMFSPLMITCLLATDFVVFMTLMIATHFRPEPLPVSIITGLLLTAGTKHLLVVPYGTAGT
jgi:hypothetical protein